MQKQPQTPQPVGIMGFGGFSHSNPRQGRLAGLPKDSPVSILEYAHIQNRDVSFISSKPEKC
jgi:hypothetical protein